MTDRETQLVAFFQGLKVLRARRLINLNIHLQAARRLEALRTSAERRGDQPAGAPPRAAA